MEKKLMINFVQKDVFILNKVGVQLRNINDRDVFYSASSANLHGNLENSNFYANALGQVHCQLARKWMGSVSYKESSGYRQ